MVSRNRERKYRIKARLAAPEGVRWDRVRGSCREGVAIRFLLGGVEGWVYLPFMEYALMMAMLGEIGVC